MWVACPSCGEGFEVRDGSVAVKATHPCPHCHRVIVVRDAHVVSPGGEVTTPFESGTKAVGPPGPQEATRVGGASLPEGRRASLAVLSGHRRGEIIPLERTRVVIGRYGSEAGADVEVNDPEVSGAHAAVEYAGGRFLLRDLGSGSGTWIGDERIEARTLEEQGEFRVGSTRFLLIVAEEE